MWPKGEGLIGDSSVVPLPAPVAHDASGGDDLDLAPGAGGAQLWCATGRLARAGPRCGNRAGRRLTLRRE